MTRTYKTAQGKQIDLAALQAKHEQTRAVGNMPVNARGDLIDSFNNPVVTRNEQVARDYRTQVTNVTDSAVPTSKRAQQSVLQPDNQTSVPPVVEETVGQPESGLAAAVARAKANKTRSSASKE